MSKTIVLAGGSGFLGQSLARSLASRDYRVVILTRSPARSGKAIEEIGWDGRTLGQWARSLEGASAVVNLTGRSVNCRYTLENRREIIDSRVNSVQVIGKAIRQCAQPPPVLVQASSLAIYGDGGDEWLDETSSSGAGSSVEVCKLWEKALEESVPNNVRRVVLRIGFVLGSEGGALGTLARLARLGLGGRVGPGTQYISWIHQRDMDRMFLNAIEGRVAGIFNGTGPEPVTNAVFMRELRHALHRPWSPPVPTWAVHIGCFFMRTEPSLALTGRRCKPRRFVEEGFAFEFPSLGPALREIFHRPKL